MTRSFQQVIDDTPQLLLRKSLSDSAPDPKMAGTIPVIYAIDADIEQAKSRTGDTVRVLPLGDMVGFQKPDAVHGLLYLPYPYVVPGGRFNEMYGWDSAFPVFAWADSHPRLMREQADNQLYQIRAYGKVLNANRTYYLSRSQPPLIAAMILRLWQAAQKRDWRDFDPDSVYADAETWLAAAYRDLVSYHGYWTARDRQAGETGLARYWDDGDGIAAEVLLGEPGHYEHAMEHFKQHPDERFYKDGVLTAVYYRADRAMRASGFDPTGHWGYGALECLFHAPACLNALLYRMEGDLGEIADILGAADGDEWRTRQTQRKSAMQPMLDPATGLYHDYDTIRKSRNTKPFATFFHAHWAGLYEGDAGLAKKAADTALTLLETPYGIMTSTEQSGSQWDFPYGWPPLQYFAFEGLRRSGQTEAAKRVARKFIALAERVFAERAALFEKYNMRDGNAEVSVVHGYSTNVTESGTFLWTAAVLKLAQGI
ncbi:MAG: trehalase family glycosidase [bacterium]|nr:trehalase family glycosidase [bacterium]